MAPRVGGSSVLAWGPDFQVMLTNADKAGGAATSVFDIHPDGRSLTFILNCTNISRRMNVSVAIYGQHPAPHFTGASIQALLFVYASPDSTSTLWCPTSIPTHTVGFCVITPRKAGQQVYADVRSYPAPQLDTASDETAANMAQVQ